MRKANVFKFMVSFPMAVLLSAISLACISLSVFTDFGDIKVFYFAVGVMTLITAISYIFAVKDLVNKKVSPSAAVLCAGLWFVVGLIWFVTTV